MAFSGLKLTDFGLKVNLKAQAGKPVRLTRIVIGDGEIGSGSFLARKTLISEKLSVPIDDVRVGDDTASVIGRISNSDLDTGFYFREMSIYCEDPDTLEEGAYVYDNCREQGEYIGDKNSPVPVNFYMRMHLAISQSMEITFVSSGNPVYVLYDEFEQRIATKEGLLKSSPTKASLVDADSVVIADSEATDGTKRVAWANIKTALLTWLNGLFVPITRKINNKALGADISLTAADVGAAPTGHASGATTYGKGTNIDFGHLKLYAGVDSVSNVDSGIAAAPAAVKTAYDTAVNANNNANGRAPTSHASTATTHGIGTSANYGHVKLTNAVNSTSGQDAGIAASPAAVKTAYDTAQNAYNTAAARMPIAGGTFTGNIAVPATTAYEQNLVRNIYFLTWDMGTGYAMGNGNIFAIYE